MLKKRIIPCLDIRDGKVTKGIEFKNNLDLGDPVPLAKLYSDTGADEIVIYDITASVEKRPPDYLTISRIAADVFVPITIGGGIVNFEMAARCIAAGAEKVSLNSVAPKNPELMREISAHFGTQALVLSVDVARDSSTSSGYRLYTQGGRNATDWDAIHWIQTAVPFGVGEICINSIDEDGKGTGYDLVLLKKVREAIVKIENLPLIISGGAGSTKHMAEAFFQGADAALTASIVHFGKSTLAEIKQGLSSAGVPMRLV